MNNDLEFAECNCGHPTPIRPAKLAQQEGDQKWTKTDDPFVFVACIECKRVYSFETQNLKEGRSDYGLSPYNPQAPMHVFRVNVPCGKPGCDTPLSVIAVRKRNTSPEAIQKEWRDEWHWEGLKCPNGYPIPDRPKKTPS